MKKLGAILEEAGVIDEIQLVRALSHQRKYRCKLGKSLVDLGFVTEDVIAKTIAKQLGMIYRELKPEETPGELLEQIPKTFATEKGLFPVGYAAMGGTRTALIAISDPIDEESIGELEKSIGLKLSPVIAKEGAIADAIRGWDRYRASNKRFSAGTTPPPAQAKPPTPAPVTAPAPEQGKIEETLFESADVLDDEWHMNVSIAKPVDEPPVAPRLPKPPPLPNIEEENAFPSAVPDVPPTPQAKNDEILSVAGLKDMRGPEDEDEMDDLPEIEHSEAWEQAMPEGTSHNAPPQPEEIDPDVEHSEPWESIMPGVDAAAEEVPDIESVPVDESPEASSDMEVNHEPLISAVAPPPEPVNIPTPPPAKAQTPPPVKSVTPLPMKSATPPPAAQGKTPPPMKATTPAPAKPAAPVTLDEISGEIVVLKSQVGSLIEEIKTLKEEMKKNK